MSLARSKFGIHLPNWGDYSLTRLLQVGFDIYFGLQTNREDLMRIQAQQPGALVLARWWDPHILSRDPQALAEEMVAWAYSSGVFHLVPGNELNLKDEHGGRPGRGPTGQWDSWEDYAEVEEWLLRVVRAGRKADPYGRVFWWRPAESPGHSEDSPDHGFIGWQEFPQSLREYDGVTIHSYWERGSYESEWYGQRWARKLRLLEQLEIDRPALITETNRPWDHRSPDDGEVYAGEQLDLYRRAYAEAQLVGVCPFLWASGDSSFRDLAWVSQDGAEQPVVAHIAAAEKPAVEPGHYDDLDDDLVARYGVGFARVLGDYAPLVGRPLQREVQIATQQEVPTGEDAYAFSFLATERGRLLWEKRSNRMLFVEYGVGVHEL